MNQPHTREALQQMLYDNAPEGMLICDFQGNIYEANAWLCNLTGYSYEVICTMNITSILDESELKRIPFRGRELLDSGQLVTRRTFVSSSGEQMQLEIFSKVLPDGLVLVYIRDISPRIRMEDQLREREEQYRRIVETAEEGIWQMDAEHLTTFVNKRMASMLGFEEAEMIGRPVESFMIREELADHEQKMGNREKGSSDQYIRKFLRKNGTVCYTRVCGTPIMDQEGRFAGSFGMFTDITELLGFEQAIRNNEERLRILINSSPDIICFKDADGRWLLANDSLLKLYGLTGVDYVHKSEPELSEFTFPIFREAFRNCQGSDDLAWERGTESRTSERIPDSGGAEHVFDVVKVPLYNEDGTRKGIVVFGRDITDMMSAEKALMEEENKFRGFFENAPIGIWLEDFSAIKHWVEQTRGHGLDPEAILTGNEAEVKKLAGMVKVVDVNETSVNLLGEISKVSLTRHLPDYFNPDSLRVFEQEMITLIRGEKVFHSEIPITTTLGEKYLNLSLAIQPGYEESWERILVSFTDITEQKRMERELRQREILLSRIFDILPIGLWFADKNGKLLRGNPAGIRIWGAEPKVGVEEYGVFKARRLPGRTEIQPDDWALAHTIRDGVVITGELLEIDAFDGKKKIILNSTAPVIDDNGKTEGALVVNLDISERVKAEERLKLLADFQSSLLKCRTREEIHQELVHKVYEILGHGVVFTTRIRYGGKAGIVSYAGLPVSLIQVAQLIGVDPLKARFDIHDITPEEMANFRSGRFLELPGGTHALATRKMPLSITRAVDKLLGTGRVFTIGFIHNRQHFGGLVVLTHDDLSEYMGIIEMIVHQTTISLNRIETEDALRETESRFRQAFHTSPDSININNAETGEYVDVNEGFLKLTGYSREEVIGKTSMELGIWADPSVRVTLRELLEKEEKVSNLEGRFRFKDGTIHTGLMSASIINIDGVPHIISITRDIEEIKKTQVELFAAKEAAEEASRLKTAFLNNISHEVRTPMNAIMGFSELLQSDEYQEAEKSRFHTIIHSNARQLLSIIDDVLEISRMDSGRMPYNPGSFSLSNMMEDVFLSFSELVSRKGLAFSISTDQAIRTDTIMGDREKIRQVINGFISNALKFTLKGSISFGYKLYGEEIEFFVTDTGLGIPVSEQERIFERFYQIKTPNMPDVHGTGLGLSIARGLVEVMNGTLGVESSPGEGAKFWFRIPFKSQPHRVSPGIDVKTGTLKKLTVLVAEDEDYNFEFLEIFLSKQVKQIIRANNGEEAIDRCEQHRPDLVLMDLKMPIMNGYEATRIIRSKMPTIPVIALTAFTQPEEEHKAIEAGCIAFISKPIRTPELMEVIRKIVRN